MPNTKSLSGLKPTFSATHKPMTYNSRIFWAMLLVFTLSSCSPPTGTVPSGIKGRIVFTSDKAGSDDIYTSDLDGQNLKRLTNSPKREAHPKWSPDGKRIVFSSDLEDLYLMNADGSDQIRLNIAPYKSAYFPQWSPDGKKIAFSTDTSFAVLDLQTGTLSKLGSIGIFPSWSPDGKKLVFVGLWGKLPTQYFSTINADGTGQTNLLLQGDTNVLERPGVPSWAPDGKTIAFGNAITKYYSPDLGPFRDIAINTGIQQKLEEMFSKVAIIPFIMIMQPDGSGVRQLTDQCSGGRWSPDSKWIICMSNVNGNNNSFEMYLVDVSSGNSFRLTDTPYNESDPDWAP